MITNSDYGTKMDDVILESLKPQVEEIKKKLAGGGGLSHEDIITLTIYTQGNHVNHIDMRMDSLCNDFSALRVDFAGLESRMESKFAGLEGSVNSRISGLETKIEKVRAEFAKQTATIGGICAAAVAIATVISNILK
ncbi:MAG: hypothetical protein FWC26_01630 [Fibromonadales bacterium]|nr:hypothetical protein [Fibromonadales bacterium]